MHPVVRCLRLWSSLRQPFRSAPWSCDTIARCFCAETLTYTWRTKCVERLIRESGALECAARLTLMSDVTGLLDRWNGGDPDALKELLAVSIRSLKRVADDLLRRERVRSHAAADGARARGVHPPDRRCAGCASRDVGTSMARRRWRCAASWSTTRASVRRSSAAARTERAPLEEALNAAGRSAHRFRAARSRRSRNWRRLRRRRRGSWSCAISRGCRFRRRPTCSTLRRRR